MHAKCSPAKMAYKELVLAVGEVGERVWIVITAKARSMCVSKSGKTSLERRN